MIKNWDQTRISKEYHFCWDANWRSLWWGRQKFLLVDHLISEIYHKLFWMSSQCPQDLSSGYISGENLLEFFCTKAAEGLFCKKWHFLEQSVIYYHFHLSYINNFTVIVSITWNNKNIILLWEEGCIWERRRGI